MLTDKNKKVTDNNIMETKTFIFGDNVKIVNCNKDLSDNEISEGIKEKVFIVTQVNKDNTYIVANEELKFKLASKNLKKC